MRLCFASFLKTTITLAFLLAVHTSYAQLTKYEKIDLQIDSLVDLGLPKSALVQVQKLERMARAEHNDQEQIRAVISSLPTFLFRGHTVC